MVSRVNRTSAKDRNTKIEAGIDKHLGGVASLLLAGETFTPTSLKAVFVADTEATNAADLARKSLSQAVVNEKESHKRATLYGAALRNYLIGTYGKQAVAILGDFGINAPKVKPARTVANKAVAVAKAKVTREVRGTKGALQKKLVTGSVDEGAIETAINKPTATGTPGAAAPRSPATPPAPAPSPVAPTAPAAATVPRAGGASQS